MSERERSKSQRAPGQTAGRTDTPRPEAPRSDDDVVVRRLQPTVIARRRVAPAATPARTPVVAAPAQAAAARAETPAPAREATKARPPVAATATAARAPAVPVREEVPAPVAPATAARAPSAPAREEEKRAPAPGATTPRAPSAPAKKSGVETWQGRPGVPMGDWAARQARRAQPTGSRPALPFSPAPRSQNAARSANVRAPLAARPAPAPARPAPLRALPGQRRGPQRAPVSGAGVRRPTHQHPYARTQAPAATAERRADKRVIKIEGTTRVSTLAASLGVKALDVLRRLLALGAKGLHLNSTLDVDTAALVAAEFGWSVENQAVSDAERVNRARAGITAGTRQSRAPVVTVMGHVDHGKTSLLDRIRQTRVAEGEAGGITQHIGAYVAETPRGRLTFIDTPGHAAFGALRARGARVTDVVVLVVAADDGLMPQTREAIAHAREAGVPIVVAINKMDVPGADAPRVRRELSEVGLVPEAWGGDTLVAEVSAKTGAGIEALLDALLLQADLLGLSASPDGAGSGVVLEARLDKGRGPLATVLVKEGTLRVRDTLLVGDTFGKVRALQDERGRAMEEAGPSTPVVVVGLEALPRPGDAAVVVKDVAAARQISVARHDSERASQVTRLARPTLGDLSRALGPRVPELRFVVKADTDGSTEALRSVLSGLSRPELTVEVVHSGVGAVTESDVQLAAASSALLLGFQVDVVGRARTLARQLQVETREYDLIYELADDVARRIARRLAPVAVEAEIGRAEVRQVFAAGSSRAAGCRVLAGVIRRGARLRLERAGNVLWQGGLTSLRRFREDVREVAEGLECGIVLAGFSELEPGDVLVASETSHGASPAPLEAALAS